MNEKPTSYRTLFKERMTREGRLAEYTETYRGMMDKGMPFLKAQYDTMLVMGYEGPEKERLLALKEHEKQIKFSGRDIEKLAQEFDLAESDLPPDIAFVFHSLHKAKGDRSGWRVSPKSAPTPGAWNMLIWASENMTKFMELVIREQLRGSGKAGEEQGMGDTGESITQLEEMLSSALIPNESVQPST